MVWIDTKKYKDKVEIVKGKVYDEEKLRSMRDEGWKPKFVDVPKFITRFKFARPIKLVIEISPSEILLTPSSGFNCQNCGLYNRHPFCSPDSPTFSESNEIIRGYRKGILFITQNDGKDPWNEDPTQLSHIKFEEKKGFALRGAEAGTTRYLQQYMKLLEMHMRRMGLRSQAFISGHCELCGRCPVKGYRDDGNKQVSCPLGGLPSMETWWIDVYRWFTHGTLGTIFKVHSDVIRPLTFVCQDYFTLFTLLLYDNKKKRYWYQENYKQRLKNPSNKDIYKSVHNAIKRSVNNRKLKGTL